MDRQTQQSTRSGKAKQQVQGNSEDVSTKTELERWQKGGPWKSWGGKKEGVGVVPTVANVRCQIEAHLAYSAQVPEQLTLHDAHDVTSLDWTRTEVSWMKVLCLFTPTVHPWPAVLINTAAFIFSLYGRFFSDEDMPWRNHSRLLIRSFCNVKLNHPSEIAIKQFERSLT